MDAGKEKEGTASSISFTRFWSRDGQVCHYHNFHPRRLLETKKLGLLTNVDSTWRDSSRKCLNSVS